MLKTYNLYLLANINKRFFMEQKDIDVQNGMKFTEK